MSALIAKSDTLFQIVHHCKDAAFAILTVAGALCAAMVLASI